MLTRLLLAVTTFCALTSAAQAADYVVPYLGYYDITQQDNQAAQFGLEYRFSPIEYGIRPTIGAYATSDGSVYGYGGLNWDIALTPQLYIIPNFMAGAYGHGDGKRLGGVIEFRSGLEIAYQFQNQHRLGISFNHTSNASIYEHNPGVEVLLINYQIPLSAFSGR